jgi:hypothetical protein
MRSGCSANVPAAIALLIDAAKFLHVAWNCVPETVRPRSFADAGLDFGSAQLETALDDA